MEAFPSIDARMKTIYLCGFKNTGKNTFLNTVSENQVSAQPYAFESLFVAEVEHHSELYGLLLPESYLYRQYLNILDFNLSIFQDFWANLKAILLKRKFFCASSYLLFLLSPFSFWMFLKHVDILLNSR